MLKKYISWINLVLAAFSAILVTSTIFIFFTLKNEINVPEILCQKASLPVGSFYQELEKYDAVGASFLALHYQPMNLRLPDLRQFLQFYGRNARPDADAENSILHFGLSDNQNFGSLKQGNRLYLVYDKQKTQGQYSFSPNNNPTTLWIEASGKDNEAVVKVFMKGDTDEIIQEPKDHSQLTLRSKENARTPQDKWELGKWRVDGTLLVRQKARWYGTDHFLQKHGGEEYQELVGKQRLDFGEGEDGYSVYIGHGDALIWEEEIGWKTVKPGNDSVGHPLIVVNKIEDRIIKLDLWDPEGRSKIPLTLLKSSETWLPQQLEKQFKFVGARTRSQFVFEVNDERMFIRPKDWLVMTDTGWKKISTVKELDDFVDRKIIGPLFVFENVETKEGKQVLIGTLYNASRTEEQLVEIAVQQGAANFTSIAKDNDYNKNMENINNSGDDSEKHARNIIREKLRLKSSERMSNIQSS